MAPSSFIDPASLALATTPAQSYASPSPSPSSPTTALPASTSTSAQQPPRKRARTELSSEDRKEARAHRNRIAAQNSRDRRKAQFSYLERRVQELEDENRRLRAGLPIPSAASPPSPSQPLNLALPSLASLASEEMRIRREQERERENEELKERIRTLERGWDAVVKALAAQGLPTGIPSTSSDSASGPSSDNNTSSTSKSSSSTTGNAGQSSSKATSPSSPTSTPANNNSLPMNGFSAFPSPAPSPSLDAPSSTPFALQPSIHTRQQQAASASTTGISARPVTDSVTVSSIDKNSTRHLARVATIEPLGLIITDDDDDDFGCDEDAKMEDLFREIFVEAAAPTANDETTVVVADVAGDGKAVVGEEGRVAEGPSQGASVGESGERKSGSELGAKRKREEDEEQATTTATTTVMSDEDMQRMLNDIEVSMMMGNIDPSLALPMAVDNFGSLDMSLLGFGDATAPFVDFASVSDFGMWAPTNSTATATGVF
ncbi:hypothetical protein H1R20_g316, partial [Candolleomyces eurysporus]